MTCSIQVDELSLRATCHVVMRWRASSVPAAVAVHTVSCLRVLPQINFDKNRDACRTLGVKGEAVARSPGTSGCAARAAVMGTRSPCIRHHQSVSPAQQLTRALNWAY